MHATLSLALLFSLSAFTSAQPFPSNSFPSASNLQNHAYDASSSATASGESTYSIPLSKRGAGSLQARDGSLDWSRVNVRLALLSSPFTRLAKTRDFATKGNQPDI